MQRLVPVAATSSSRLFGVKNLLLKSSQSGRRALSSSILLGRNQNRLADGAQQSSIDKNK